MVGARSAAERTWKLCLVTDRVTPIVSTSWKASPPIRGTET